MVSRSSWVHGWRAAWVVLPSWAVWMGCSGDSDQTLGQYRATIRRTSFDVAHVVAADLASAGFGQGYVSAEDYLCTIADQVLKVRGERASWFGAGPDNQNIDSDLAYRALDLRAAARRALAQQPREVADFVAGYAAGYDAFLASDAARAVACAGEWLVPIDAEDVYAHALDLAMIGPIRNLMTAIGHAQPPSAEPVGASTPALALDWATPASNGWAIGADASESGSGMLLASPHFPWEGELRLHEVQLTVPGELDAYGVTLVGFPGVTIGFNENVAWTQTASLAPQTVFFRLALEPGAPTRYRMDGEARDMQARAITVEVRDAEPVTRTLYSSEHGLIVDVPGVGWTADTAIAVASPNLQDDAVVTQYLQLARASDLSEFQAALALQGIPWATTLYADRDGNALFADTARVPDVPLETIQTWLAQRDADPIVGTFWSQGLILLDGTRELSGWAGEGVTRVVPFEGTPQLVRRDFVFNANDSYATAHPGAALGPYHPFYGAEIPPRARTRLTHELLTNADPAAAAGDDGRWSVGELQSALLRGDAWIARQLRAAVVRRCEGAPAQLVDGATVDVAPACDALAGWDGRVALESRGAAIWRELLADLGAAALTGAGPLFAVGFDPADPIGTPRDLAPAPAAGPDPVLVALARASARLAQSNIDPASSLEAIQSTRQAERSWAVPGARDFEGSLNQATFATNLNTTLLPRMPRADVLPVRTGALATGLTSEGYAVNFGASFMLVLEFRADGPHAEAILNYGNKDPSTHPDAGDQFERYAASEWRPIVFHDADIANDAALTEILVEAPR